MNNFIINRKTFRMFRSGYSLYERQIEIPYVLDYIHGSSPSGMLEIGNCLYNVGVTGHTVVDKYEQAEGVINIDIEEFKHPSKFNTIISISTLEHIGKDEGLTDSLTQDKLIKVFDIIQNNLLDPINGKFLFTIPIGYNTPLDQLIFDFTTKLTSAYFMRQVRLDEWLQTTVLDAKTAQYNHPFPAGNVILFGEIKNG